MKNINILYRSDILIVLTKDDSWRISSLNCVTWHILYLRKLKTSFVLLKKFTKVIMLIMQNGPFQNNVSFMT